MPDLQPPSKTSASCWVLTEGHAGMQNQCVGLAEALGLTPIIKQVKPTAPWKYLPPNLWPRPLRMAAPCTNFDPPWPDVLISCGRRSVAAAMAIRQASGGKTFAIHIQDPHVPADRFDLLIVPDHDRLRADNVIVVRGALHHVTPQKLEKAADHFRPLLAALPRPIIAVLVGGSNRRQELTPALITDLAARLRVAAEASAGSVGVTPSRRTGAVNEALLRSHLRDMPTYIYDGQGENPYLGLLALADVIVATSDSVSMVTEACVTGKPVYVYDIPGGSKRLAAFNRQLIEDGVTRTFTGRIEQWPGTTLHETARVAALIQPKLTARMTGAK